MKKIKKLEGTPSRCWCGLRRIFFLFFFVFSFWEILMLKHQLWNPNLIPEQILKFNDSNGIFSTLAMPAGRIQSKRRKFSYFLRKAHNQWHSDYLLHHSYTSFHFGNRLQFHGSIDGLHKGKTEENQIEQFLMNSTLDLTSRTGKQQIR